MTRRAFIGTYPCALCALRVRVYDWLPECVLCAQCKRRVERDEARSETNDCDNIERKPCTSP